MTNGILVCRVNSWLTGRRLVSVPFADHCEPLFDTLEERRELLEALELAATAAKWRYVELRPKTAALAGAPSWQESSSYQFHELDLRPSLDQLYRGMHRSTIQRKIERAEREGLTHREGTSDALLAAFYGLVLLTRRRHGLPPQPLQWFSNVVACCGNEASIRVAYKGDRPVSAMLTLRHRDTLIYKYGCSDAAFHNLGPMPSLFWTTIRAAKAAGLEKLDLGRSDWENNGLRTFKERLGATPSPLTYLRYNSNPASKRLGVDRLRVPAWVMSAIPDRVLTLAGRVLYRHMA